MDSSDSDRDRKPSSPQGSTENPFIRFRHFADSRISAALQGIIGLPSAISKSLDASSQQRDNPSGDLNGGERQQAEQHVETRENGRSLPAQDELPISKFCRQPTVSSPPGSPIEPSTTSSGQVQGDMDLYSPVIKSLFAHLNRTIDDSDWNKRTDAKTIFDMQKSPNALNMIQSIMYDALNAASRGTGCRLFHSEKSLLPYILFSPYSPLGISSIPSPLQARVLSMSPNDSFPYRRAFTDLLLASQGREMSQWKPCRDALDKHRESILDSGFGKVGDLNQSPRTPPDKWNAEIMRAHDSVNWIEDLHDLGLLSTDQSRWGDVVRSWPSGSIVKMKIPGVEVIHDESSSPSMPTKSAQTEQDMYNHFLEAASSSPNPISNDLGSVIEEAEKFAMEQSKRLLQQRDDFSASHGPARIITEIFDDIESIFNGRAPRSKSDTRSTRTQTAPSDQSLKSKYESEIDTYLNEIQAKADDVHEDNRIVATMKDIERVTLEDGSIRTTVKIKKVFGDGRSVTETTHSQSPPSPEDGLGRWFGDENRNNGVHGDGRLDVKPKDQENGETLKKNDNGAKKKGWFWN
jgi:hypothetical protein